MKRIVEFISNAIKYYINHKRVTKLRKKGAQIGKNVINFYKDCSISPTSCVKICSGGKEDSLWN